MSGDDASAGWDKGRMDAFSDGVFAIAITILVLEIKVPSDLSHLGRDLEHEWPAYLAYVTSFSTIGGVWIALHRLFSGLRVIDATMVELNLLLLLFTAFPVSDSDPPGGAPRCGAQRGDRGRSVRGNRGGDRAGAPSIDALPRVTAPTGR